MNKTHLVCVHEHILQQNRKYCELVTLISYQHHHHHAWSCACLHRHHAWSCACFVVQPRLLYMFLSCCTYNLFYYREMAGWTSLISLGITPSPLQPFAGSTKITRLWDTPPTMCGYWMPSMMFHCLKKRCKKDYSLCGRNKEIIFITESSLIYSRSSLQNSHTLHS